jgi:hypothetical protein
MRPWTFLIIFIAALSLPDAAQAEAPPLTASEQAFISAYIKALKESDTEQLRALTDPNSVACIERMTPRWFEQTLYPYKNFPAVDPPDVTLSDFSITLPPGIIFPDPPQKLLVMEWKNRTASSAQRGAGIQLSLIETDGGVFQVLPCPSEETIKKRDEFFRRQGYQPSRE